MWLDPQGLLFLGVLFQAAAALSSASAGDIIPPRDDPEEPGKVHPGRPDTRCNPVNGNDIQISVNNEWVHLHTCKGESACHDILGGGACYDSEEDIFVFPDIDDLETKSLHPGGVDADDSDNGSFDHGTFEPFVLPPITLPRTVDDAQYKGHTRCNPETLSEIQRFDGTAWVTDHKCYNIKSCLNLHGIGVCQVLPQPTRCDPSGKGDVQFFNGDNWYTYFKCQEPHECVDLNGVGACHLSDDTYRLPLDYIVDGHVTRRASPGGKETAISLETLETRCQPKNDRKIQVFVDGKWKKLGKCPEHTFCFHELKSAFCVQRRETVFNEHPPIRNAPHVEPNLHSEDTRCNPQNMSEIQIFRNSEWLLAAICQGQTECKDINGMGGCEVGPSKFIIPAFNDTTPIDIHLIDPPTKPSTRCNPVNNTESEVWSRAGWVLDGVCEKPFICYDFVGVDVHTICVVPGTVSRTVYLPVPVQDTDDSLSDPTLIPRDVEKIITRCEGNTLFGWFDGAWNYQRTCPDGFSCGDMPIEGDKPDKYSQPTTKACVSHDARSALTGHPDGTVAFDESEEFTASKSGFKGRLDQPISTFSPRYENMHARRTAEYEDTVGSQSIQED